MTRGNLNNPNCLYYEKTREENRLIFCKSVTQPSFFYFWLHFLWMFYLDCAPLLHNVSPKQCNFQWLLQVKILLTSLSSAIKSSGVDISILYKVLVKSNTNTSRINFLSLSWKVYRMFKFIDNRFFCSPNRRSLIWISYERMLAELK